MKYSAMLETEVGFVLGVCLYLLYDKYRATRWDNTDAGETPGNQHRGVELEKLNKEKGRGGG